MQPADRLSSRQQQLGLLVGRTQPDVLEAARVAALLNGQSGTFNFQSGLASGGLHSLGPAPAGLNLALSSLPQTQSAPQPAQLALPDLALLSQLPHALFPQQYSSGERDQLGGLRNVGKTRSSDSRSSSAYASRHQAAEQRRRTRINERLELLRKLVPHAERANTACFLEEVIKYIELLKRRQYELEKALETATGKPISSSLTLQGIQSANNADQAQDSQVPSPRQPTLSSGQGVTSILPRQTSSDTAPRSPSAPPPPALSTQQATTAQQQQQAQSQPPPPSSAAAAAAAPPQEPPQPSQLQHLPQLQLAQPTASSQLGQLQLPSSSSSNTQQLQLQQQQQSLLFPHGATLSLAGGPLSLNPNVNALSLAQLTAGLQGHHHHHGTPLHLHPHHGSHHLSAHHHHVAQQLSELQTMHAMHSLQQQSRAAAASAGAGHPPAFHPTNNKAFLHFNEDLFGAMKPELVSARGLQAAASAGGVTFAGAGAGAASATPSTSLQLTTLGQLPVDSSTLAQVEATRKTLSASPVSSEESGVPLKKRKVLML
ncbi:hypothetical protein Agub_g12760 [Astrephomene gubernaculifera]|uniref:BHLH domain-containing protein n=1 Tax=Astrephomene gubernaculifera TaxID=47775 RepID=A0AAD3HS10_9CHLO|nr:hypothetical protein Agub_g12760 [Astrephomene gubernaculifera]